MIAAIYAALIFVLAVASSAEAACAWVLWTYSENKWQLLPVLGVAAFETLAGCEDYRVKLIQLEVEERRLGLRTGAPLLTTCLPDTIDPRGPKGGAR